MKTPATLLCDFYKLSHREQYPVGTEMVYSTWTPRSNKYRPWVSRVVVFGVQAFVKKYLVDYFNENFFARPLADITAEYARVVRLALGVSDPDTTHIEELHALGYLPLRLRALPEGTLAPIKVPMLTIENTSPRFFWLTNFVETLLSAELWLPSTSATIANEYRGILDSYAERTGDPSFAQFQGHDFSMRGMGCVEAAASSGAGHLLSFVGTDTIPAIFHLEKYYNADIETELVGTSIPATEHSVMCAGGQRDEFQTYSRLINEVYPSGLLSIVSDTWDLWYCLTGVIAGLKDDILRRDGKVVIRPDSGDPVEILCGTSLGLGGHTPEEKGVVETLWDIFGGVVNSKGYKELDPHIGVIYGESITTDRCRRICQRLAEKGFASTNVVFGIGSYTYQYNSRDTFGFALKSTACVVEGEFRAIFKSPATDDGTKRSNTGRVAVVDVDGKLTCLDGLTNTHPEDEMRDVFLDGRLLVDDTLAEIRSRLRGQN